jgi:hypothetical protein
MAKVYSNTKTESLMRADFKKVSFMAREFLSTQMEDASKENGTMGNY